MARRGATLDELFDRPYRPGAAFGPRISPLRRWGMCCVLVLLVGVILTYWYLTDARRVRAMAENYLSRLTGGHVTVRDATLSIFEGLRLDGVSVRVDEDEKSPDGQVFHAGTILIKYDPQSIFSGRLEATQIVALDPQVFLCEDLDKGQWNWQRLTRQQTGTTRPTPGPPIRFPEILLRNAHLNYSRLRNRELLRDRGLMEIEGVIKPGENNSVTFRIQSRGGDADAMGPAVKGQFNFETKALSASLERFTFGKDIEVMLPEQVRRWWVNHKLSGGLDIPKFWLLPGRDGQKSKFRIETVLRRVTLQIQPEEWLSADEEARLDAMGRAVGLMKNLGLDAGGFASNLSTLFEPSAVDLEKVEGQFVFTQDGIEISDVAGSVEQNPFTITGRIKGYTPQAAASITFASQDVTIPHAPRYVNSMPNAFRDLYEHLRPEGRGGVSVTVDRATPGAKPTVAGRVNVIDGNIRFDEFPYPLRAVTGGISFGWDAKSQMDRVDVDIRGLGVAGGPNNDVTVAVKGFVGPLGRGDSEFDFWVLTDNVHGEPALTAAYPPPVREALKIFDAPGKGLLPQYTGGFVAHIHRPYGVKQKWDINIDVDLADAAGRLTFFPYPIEHLTGKLHITDDRVDLIGIKVAKGDASVGVDGVVRFGKDKPIDPQIRLTARDVPIDDDLRAALPPDPRAWLEKIGVGGKLDVDGTIARAVGGRRSAVGSKGVEDQIGYDLQLRLKDGTFFPGDNGAFAATAATGTMRLTNAQLVVTDLRGRRGKAELSGSGILTWGGGTPGIVIAAAARNLRLDKDLYKLLPLAWRGGWDQARPEGTVDIDVTYSGAIDPAAAAAAPPAVADPQAPAAVVAVVPAIGPAAPDPVLPPAAAELSLTPVGPAAEPAKLLRAAAPATRPTTAPANFSVLIRPVQLAMTPRVIPLRLEQVKGEVDIRPDRIALRDITAVRKGGGTVSYSGSAPTGAGGAWELTLSAKDITPDKELRAALPPAVAKLLDSLKVQGKLTADFSKLSYRAAADPAVADDGRFDLTGTILLADNSFEIGTPVTEASGAIAIRASARGGRLGALAGAIELTSMNVGGRVIKNFKCELAKPESEDALRVGKISGDMAGGALAGQVDLVFPDKGPSRFGLGLVLRNADVRELAGAGEKDIKGSLSASLALEGDWGAPGTRRGRGDVAVTGKDMYRIPLVLGLMQITNLALPISSPFNDAAARYTVEGEKVSFEQIELRASNMLMSGSGWLDFKSKKVKMTFITDNPNAWRIPFISDLIQGARQEFMQIHITGTVQEPKVKGAMMSTFTTTIDEVFDKNGSKRGGR